MWNFQLENLGELDQQLIDTFKELPETDYLDGKYRLRRYSVFKQTEGFHATSFVKLPPRSFVQSSHYNKHQGNVKREFEPISDSAAYSLSMQIALGLFLRRCSDFGIIGPLGEQEEIEVHQMRVLTCEGGQLSPEGVHQDGFDRIGMMGVNRYNITGGHLLLHKTKDSEAMADFPLGNGEIAFVNDRELWHNGSPLKKINQDEGGYMDIIIMLIKYDKGL